MLKINKNYISPEPKEQNMLNNDEWSEVLDDDMLNQAIETINWPSHSDLANVKINE